MKKLIALIAILSVLLSTGASFAEDFIPEDRLCAMRYMFVIKNLPETHSLRKDYENRFFTSTQRFADMFPDMANDERVHEINSGAQALYIDLTDGTLSSDGFWDQVISCDVEYGFTKTIKP